ncbi:MAG: TetR/AcrR family transcriptional regulator [Ruminococcus sp.]|nr:TetR/AcrR family transcriptional regulator [Ruminococcus sp.]
MNDSTNPSALRSKAEICNALLRLMDEHPYEEITVKQIALESKLVRKTFYRNFDSKDDVLDAILDQLIDEYKDRLIEANQITPIEIIFSFCSEHKEQLLLFDKNNMMYRVLQKLNEALPVKHDELVALGLVPADFFRGLDPSYLITMNIGSVWNVICRWTHGGMKDDPKQIIEEMNKFIIMMGEYAKRMTAPYQDFAK